MKQRLAAYRERYAKHLRERKQRASLPNHPLEAYAGIYENNELGTMEWRLGEEGLEVRLGVAHSSAEIYDAGDNAFRIEVNGGGSVAHFLVDESGDVSGVRFLEREFTRRP
ncbi:DUF3471 domain-containing protein [Microbulbifer halophilus]